jgi:hypothetical protein
MTKTPKLSQDDLRQFTGSEHWYRHGLNWNVLYTDGARYVADEGGAHWLLDAIALAQRFVKSLAGVPFQVWKLSVRPDQTATLTCEDGNDHVVYTQQLEFTDFPVAHVTLWFANGTIYLPNEH